MAKRTRDSFRDSFGGVLGGRRDHNSRPARTALGAARRLGGLSAQRSNGRLVDSAPCHLDNGLRMDLGDRFDDVAPAGSTASGPAAAVSTTQWELAQLDARVAAARHTIAHLVHTDLQGCAAGCAMLLEFALESSADGGTGEPASSDQLTSALQQTQARLDNALTSLDEALEARALAEQADVSAGLAALAGTWAGFVEVEVSVGPSARACADNRPAVALAVVELASEAIANAAIHGTARHVTIDVGLTNNDLEVGGSGTTASGWRTPEPGAGSASIDRLTSAWSLSNRDEGGCEFRAHIPVSPTE